MANKAIHKVSPELTDNAQFKSVHEIPTTILGSGDTILVYPGEYADPRTSNVADVAIVGVGDRDDVCFYGFSIPDATSQGANVVIKNVTIKAAGLIVGNTEVTVKVYDSVLDGTSGPARSAALALANGAVTAGVTDSNAAGAAGVSMNAAITLDHCELGTTVGPGYGVVQHCSGTVTLRHCTIASDAGALSNGNMTIEHCTFTGANNYASTIAAGLAPTITVRGSHAAAANAGNHTETVVAAIS